MRESVTSTNVFVHVEADARAAGLGLLPCFMSDRHDDLVRVCVAGSRCGAAELSQARRNLAASGRGRSGRRNPGPHERSARRAAR